MSSENYREEVREQAIRVATEAFFKCGIKRVKMDDIAHQLKISKRTLYQIFVDKEELLICCLEYNARQREEEARMLWQKYNNVLEIILFDFKRKLEYLKQTPSSFLEELVKYPRVVAKLDEMHRAQQASVERFLRIGIEQGFFLPEVNVSLCYDMMVIRAQQSKDQRLLEQYPPYQVFLHNVFYALRGITTEKGARMMDDFLRNQQQQ